MRYFAEGIRDYSPSELTETLSVLVRTTEVHVMSVSATVQITAATPMGKANSVLRKEAEMLLTADPSGRFEQAKPEAILFVMFNGNDRIACRVDWAALQDRAVADSTEGNDIAETFKRHRHTIERIASDQFDAGRQMPVVRSEHLTP